MNRKLFRRQWLLIVVAGMIAGGCLPTEYSEWSDDGSVGIMKIEDTLWLVDDKGQRTTKIDEGDGDKIGLYPTIAEDGKMAAYVKAVKYAKLDDLLGALPAGQVNMVRQAAAEMKAEILRQGGLKDDWFPTMEFGSLGYGDTEQRDLVIRYLCEHLDDQLRKMIPVELIEKSRQNEMHLYHLNVVSLKGGEIVNRKTVVRNLFPVWPPRISPDNKLLGYLVFNHLIEKDALIFDLYVASLEEDIPAMLVEKKVSYGYSWSEDSRMLAYMVQEDAGAAPIGTLQTTEMADGKGGLLAQLESKEDTERGCVATHLGTGTESELAGIFFNPLMKVEYGPGGRIFFSSGELTAPMSKIDDELRMSIFCYDPVIKTVTDVLPHKVSSQLGDSIGLFDISPDQKKILLPRERHSFLVYEFGSSYASEALGEEDRFSPGGKEEWRMAPAWRGNEEICCLVAKEGKIVEGKEVQTDKDYVRVIIMPTGVLIRILEE